MGAVSSTFMPGVLAMKGEETGHAGVRTPRRQVAERM